MEVEKYVDPNTSKVAVIFNPGWGFGWSTSVSDSEAKKFLLFDKELVEVILSYTTTLEEHEDRLSEIIGRKFKSIECSRLSFYSLEIKWVDKGDSFYIYDAGDGAEAIVILNGNKDVFTA